MREGDAGWSYRREQLKGRRNLTVFLLLLACKSPHPLLPKQRGRLRPREGKRFAQGHTARQRQALDKEPRRGQSDWGG